MTTRSTQPHIPTSRSSAGDVGAPAAVTLRSADGSAVIRKISLDRSTDAKVQREIQVLEQLYQPGIVRLADHGMDGPRPWLETPFVGASTLAQTGLRPDAMARLFADCCRVVSALHEARWAHGSIAPGHIVVDDSRRVTLCSLGLAKFPAADADIESDRENLSHVFDDAIASMEQPYRSRLLACSSSIRSTTALWEIARDIDDVLAEMPRLADTTTRPQRPAARNWRKRFRSSKAPAIVPHRDTPIRQIAQRSGPTKRVKIVGAAAVAALSTGCISWLTGSGSDADRDDAPVTSVFADPDTPVSVQPTRIQPASASASPAATTTVKCAAADSPHRADPDGDGCFEDVDVVRGLVRIGDRWYQPGVEGDVSALGDFDCDGGTDLALLRPTTGEIFLFRTWPTDGPLEMRAVAVRPDATDLQAGKNGSSSCWELSTVSNGKPAPFPIPNAPDTTTTPAKPTTPTRPSP